jgi:hypothetical protein
VNRRLGLPVVLAIVAVTLIALVAITPLLRGDDEPEPTAQEPAATACTPVADPFGSPPDGFAYEQVDEATRQKTIEALRLDAAGVDMRAARQGPLTLGTLVGVPSQDPAGYVDELVSTAERGRSPVSRQQGFTLIPLESGTVVAVGVRGCTAVLISAQDPNAVRFLATAVFVESSPR